MSRRSLARPCFQKAASAGVSSAKGPSAKPAGEGVCNARSLPGPTASAQSEPAEGGASKPLNSLSTVGTRESAEVFDGAGELEREACLSSHVGDAAPLPPTRRRSRPLVREKDEVECRLSADGDRRPREGDGNGSDGG